jgi:hypothetical protein
MDRIANENSAPRPRCVRGLIAEASDPREPRGEPAANAGEYAWPETLHGERA